MKFVVSLLIALVLVVSYFEVVEKGLTQREALLKAKQLVKEHKVVTVKYLISLQKEGYSSAVAYLYRKKFDTLDRLHMVIKGKKGKGKGKGKGKKPLKGKKGKGKGKKPMKKGLKKGKKPKKAPKTEESTTTSSSSSSSSSESSESDEE